MVTQKETRCSDEPVQFLYVSILSEPSPDFAVMGVNISNPQAGDFGNAKHLPSVTSLVVSWEGDCTRWLHSFRVQRRGEELVKDLEEMVGDVLKKRVSVLVSVCI